MYTFLYWRYMRTCFHALASETIPIMSELLHLLEASSEPRTPESHRQLRHQSLCRVATNYCVECNNHSTLTRTRVSQFWPWSIHQERIGISHDYMISRTVSHTQQNNKTILDSKDSPLGRLHLALAYRYIFVCIFCILVWMRHEKIFRCTDSRINSNYERINTCAGCPGSPSPTTV